MGPRALLVDDDPGVLAAVRSALRAGGFEVSSAGNGETALDLAATTSLDLVLLDLTLPGIDGLEVLRRLRGFSATPVIVMSARDVMGDRVSALDAGADDYLTKPFDIEELTARVRAVLRRRGEEPQGPSAALLSFGDLAIDLSRHSVLLRGEPVRLTPTEHRLLEVMASNPGKLLTHSWLLSKVWGPGYGPESYHQLRVFIRQLRAKLGDEARAARWISTETGLGYRWIAPATPEPDPALP